MEDQEVINKVREALELYGRHWDEWLHSEVCFLNSVEIKSIGYLLAFQDVEESAHLLNIAQDEYLLKLDHTIERLKAQHYQYTVWLAQKIIMST